MLKVSLARPCFSVLGGFCEGRGSGTCTSVVSDRFVVCYWLDNLLAVSFTL